MMTCGTELEWSWTPLWSCHKIQWQWIWTAGRVSGEDPANITHYSFHSECCVRYVRANTQSYSHK